MGWFLEQFKEDEEHKIDEEFDSAIRLLDNLAVQAHKIIHKNY